MSLSAGYPHTVGPFKLLGYSIAGVSTSIGFAEADVLFDVAQGLPFQTGFNTICLTHAHMDHAAGLPYLISQKSMQSRPKPVVYMPSAAVEPLTRIMKTWEEIDGYEYGFDFRATEINTRYPLKDGYEFQIFPTSHRVASNGYTVFKKKKKLKPEFAKLSSQELAQLRKNQVEIDVVESENILSFTGDTRIEFLNHEAACSSQVLIMEVTYWDQRKPVSNAREWGHIHVEEFLALLPQIRAQHIVLIHASARHSTQQIRDVIDARVPEHLKPKLSIFPRPF